MVQAHLAWVPACSSRECGQGGGPGGNCAVHSAGPFKLVTGWTVYHNSSYDTTPHELC